MNWPTAIVLVAVVFALAGVAMTWLARPK